MSFLLSVCSPMWVIRAEWLTLVCCNTNAANSVNVPKFTCVCSPNGFSVTIHKHKAKHECTCPEFGV